MVEPEQHADKNKPSNSLFEAVVSRAFGENICFLCGCELTDENRSDEHVVPRWAQERYKLWGQKLTILNGTEIRYRQLVIPCCEQCNNNHLNPVEKTMAQAVLDGPQAVAALDKHTLFLWLGKMFYGILYKELFLQAQRSDPQSDAITSPELLREYQMHHYFLQSARVPMTFVEFFPASIFVFETQMPDNPLLQWDLRDDIEKMFIACRMGRVGLIAVLQDGGAHEYFLNKTFDEYRSLSLHPLQFRELMAHVTTWAHLMNRFPKYIVLEDLSTKVIQLPLQGLSKKPIFDPWDVKLYVKIFSELTGMKISDIFRPPDEAWTSLRKADLSLNYMDFKKFPWPLQEI